MQVKDIQKATQREAAAALGVNSRTLRGWHDSGCPRNADQSYNLPDVIGWRVAVAEARAVEAEESANSPAIERWREARARLAEMDVAERERELIPASDVRRDIGTICETFKAHVLGWPSKLAATMAALDRPEDCFDEMTREAGELLDDTRMELERIADEGDQNAD